METKNIIISGVGGQGVILASEILATVAMESGYDVKKSEVHGLSQRGGDVVSHVRFGQKVYSPLVEEGTLDILISLEKAESLRYLPYIKKGHTICIVSKLMILPLRVSIGLDSYPEDVKKILLEYTPHVYLIDAVKGAKEAGEPRAANVYLLGFASNYLPFEGEVWKRVLKTLIRKEFVEPNLRAFELGSNLAQKLKISQ